MKFGYQGAYFTEEIEDFANYDEPDLPVPRSQPAHRPDDAHRAVADQQSDGIPRRSTRRTSGRSGGSRCRARSATTARGASSRPTTTARRVAGTVQPGADHVPGVERRQRLQRHHAADGRGMGRDRQREDVGPREPRQVSAGREQSAELHDFEPGDGRPQRPHRSELPDDRQSDVDRRQRQLPAGLQPDESGGQRRVRSVVVVRIREPPPVRRRSIRPP